MKITEIGFNWFYSNNGYGEEYQTRKVGKDGVKSISEHRAQCDGDKWYYDVEYDDGKVQTIFNINRVYREPLSV